MRLLIPMPGTESLARKLLGLGVGEVGALEMRRFPDEESYVRLHADVGGRDVEFLCTLARPDPQFLSLIFATATARELGAKSVGLIAPYLAYMRQDKRFKDGEAISSVHFARLLSGTFDRLITIDPHLHRRQSLGEIFTIPTRVLHAAPALADWIKANVSDPLVIGPYSESEQWVAAAAARAGAPHVVLEKYRRGDRDVVVKMPDLSQWRQKTPVLIDDIVSTGRTMIEAARQLRDHGFAKPYCVAVHALFADDAFDRLIELCERIVTTDAIPHPSNEVSVAPLLAASLI